MNESQSAALMGMLRMSDKGMFTKLSPIGRNSKDGACVSTLSSMMCERNLFQTAIGHWDEVRFGGDHELVQRLQVVLGKRIGQLNSVGSFCLDHAQSGHTLTSHMARDRKEYETSFLKWHAQLTKELAYLDFPQTARAFEVKGADLIAGGAAKRVFEVQQASPERVSERKLSADIVIVTNLRFPGGNASSTLDELRFFSEQGWSVLVVHCPTDGCLGKTTSERYAPHADKAITFHDFERLECKTLIVRHPAVACSFGFERFKHKLAPENAYFVINNSKVRPSGAPVYSIEKVYEHAKGMTVQGAQTVKVCPISPLMRDELSEIIPDDMLSNSNWTPTFDLGAYKHAPKATMSTPIAIGRHGRDGPEKWIEDPILLQRVFPSSDEFEISILGGAKNAEKILGGLPSNWSVHEFGSIAPKEYLETLDAFVYFPNRNLNEGFGRTIAEAMIGGVPCILPHKFHQVFGDLAFYGAPEQVPDILRELAKDDKGRQAFLYEVQSIAELCFSTAAIGTRFAEWPNPQMTSDTAATNNSLVLTRENATFRERLVKAVVK